MRIEVTFDNGKFVAFPEVNEKTVNDSNDGFIGFEFRGGHAAMINMKNVDFIEFMDMEEGFHM